MSRQRKKNRDQRLVEENSRLQAKLHAAHDLLHREKINDLHDLLHCESCDDASAALTGQNISQASASSLATFASEFNRLCARHRVLAAFVAAIPSARINSYSSVQMGGSVDVINFVREKMGLGATHAVGDHK